MASTESMLLLAIIALLLYKLWEQQQHTVAVVAAAAAPAPPQQQPQHQQDLIIVKPPPMTDYARIGYLSNDNGTTLPLYGRPSLTSRERFQYYVMTTDQQPIRLIVSHQGQVCTDERGCSEIMDGDQLSIAEYGGQSFRVKLYPRETMRYNPNVY